MEPVPERNLDPPINCKAAECSRCHHDLTEDTYRECMGNCDEPLCRDCFEDGENPYHQYCPTCERRLKGGDTLFNTLVAICRAQGIEERKEKR